MAVHRLRKLVNTNNGLMIEVRWKEISESEDSLEPLQKLYEGVPVLVKKLLTGKNTPANLSKKTWRLLYL